MTRPRWMRRAWWKGLPFAIRDRWRRTRIGSWLGRPWRRPTWARLSWWAARPPLSWIATSRNLAGTCFARLGVRFGYLGAWSWWKTWSEPPDPADPRSDDIRSDARSWVLNYTPGRSDETGAYGSALKYAERQYDRSIKLSEELDKKLDDLGRNALAIGAIVAAATRFLSIAGPISSSPLLLAALICFAATVIIAARTRGPILTTVPTTSRTILEVIESEPLPGREAVEAVQAASYYFADVETNSFNSWKGRQLARATVIFCAGLLFLISALSFMNPRSPTSSVPSAKAIVP